MQELLRFTTTATNGIEMALFPPKYEFVFYNNKFEMYKKGKLARTVNYEEIKEVSVVKTWKSICTINCPPIGMNIYDLSDETINKIKEITGK